MIAVLLAALTFVSTLLGGLTALKNRDRMHRLLGYTAGVLLGVVALRTGQKLEWDGPKMKAKNSKEAAQFVRRQYRKGWKL